jgi:hypothetical protein
MQKDHDVQKQYLLYKWSWEVDVARCSEGERLGSEYTRKEPKVIINNKGEYSSYNQGR